MADTLVGTYKRYKAGTSKLIDWLTDAALKCGSDLPQSLKITTAELLSLATRVISSTNPKIKIPHSLLQITEDAIEGRRSCADWYTWLAAEEAVSEATLASNSRHQHFLQVLIRIYELLKGAFVPDKHNSTVDSPTSSQADGITNLFTLLELEEPVMTYAEEAEAPKANPKQDSRARNRKPKHYELDNDEEEKSFAIWCLFKDLLDARTYVREMWKRFAAGELSFLAVSKMTDIAISIVSLEADDFGKRYPDLWYFDNVVRHLGDDAFLVQARNLQDTFAFGSNKGVFEVPAGHDMSDLLCMPAWCAISDLRDVMAILWVQDDDAELRDTKIKMRYPSHPFAKSLLGIAPLLKEAYPAISQLERKHLEEGETRSGLRHCIDVYTKELLLLTGECRPGKPRKIFTGLLAATQMYLDIYEILEGHMARGFFEALQIIKRVNASCDHFRSLCRSGTAYASKHMTSMSTTMDVISRVQNAISFGQERSGRKGWVFKLADDVDEAFLPIQMIMALPLLAAELVWIPFSILHGAGMMLLNNNQIALTAAHLYRAATTYGALDNRWKDMDFLIERFNARSPFMRTGDGTLISAAKTFRLALGMSAHQARKGIDADLPTPHQISERCVQLQFTSHYLRAFVGADNAGHHKLQDVEDAVMRRHPFYDWLRLHISESSGITNPETAKQWENTKKLTPVQLLGVLQESFAADEIYIQFDYLNFTMVCLKMLDKVAGLYFSIMKGPDWRLEEPNVPACYAVDNLLWEAVLAEKLGTGKEYAALHDAGKILEKTIHEAGNYCLSSGLHFCSGHLLEDQKPATKYPSGAIKRPNEPDMPFLVLCKHSIADTEEDLARKAQLEVAICREIEDQFDELLRAGTSAEVAHKTVQAHALELFRDAQIRKASKVDVIKGKAKVFTYPLTTANMTAFVRKKLTSKEKTLSLRVGISLQEVKTGQPKVEE